MLREKVVEIGEKALKIMDDYFDGRREGTDKIKEASRMITQAIKVEHMNQIQKNSDRSFALRLLPFLPNDESKTKYIELTNPSLKPLLLLKPKK